jgi:hypothetical protein
MLYTNNTVLSIIFITSDPMENENGVRLTNRRFRFFIEEAKRLGLIAGE